MLEGLILLPVLINILVWKEAVRTNKQTKNSNQILVWFPPLRYSSTLIQSNLRTEILRKRPHRLGKKRSVKDNSSECSRGNCSLFIQFPTPQAPINYGQKALEHHDLIMSISIICAPFISEISSLLVVPPTPYRPIRPTGSASNYWISSVIVTSPNDLFVPRCCASSQPFNPERPHIKVHNQLTVELNQYSFEVNKSFVLWSPRRSFSTAVSPCVSSWRTGNAARPTSQSLMSCQGVARLHRESIRKTGREDFDTK